VPLLAPPRWPTAWTATRLDRLAWTVSWRKRFRPSPAKQFQLKVRYVQRLVKCRFQFSTSLSIPKVYCVTLYKIQALDRGKHEVKQCHFK